MRNVLVAGLRSQDCGTANVAVERHVVGIDVGSVEATGETTHDFDVGIALGCVEDLVDLGTAVSRALFWIQV